ncbi:hypothetical protein QFC21_001737 [Naganishia friedmannii]|uniref:Uncharacterized protein n=1 Tax=Naganishia friedmannii TaxID=89922 RepID=A0ACC2W121_9TREE|nr:hypothetical protein QFC21_001737 [Naganishia friedmannii]
MVGSPGQQLGTPKQVPAAANRTPSTAAAASTARPDRQAIKIRVVSWNLGDSLPKGDLATLLGEIPPYHPPDHLVTSFPTFDSTDGEHHPYHLIVVAAQECPSASGVPRGLAAGVAKGVIGGSKEKDKLKERGKAKEAEKAEKAEKAWIAQLERIHGTGTQGSSCAGTPIQETSPVAYTFPPRVPPKDSQQEFDTVVGSLMSTISAEPSIAETRNESGLSAANGTEEDLSAEGPTVGNPLQPGSLPAANSTRTPHHMHHTPHITTGNKGWSDLLEDYLCRGVKHDPKARTRRSGSISFRQGSISGSLPSTPSQVPGYNPFLRGGSGPSPSAVPEGNLNTPTAAEGADRRPSTLSTSPRRMNSASPVDGGACPAPSLSGDPTPRRSVPIRAANGLVPPPAVVKPVRERSAGSEAPPSPTFSFELQTPTPVTEFPPAAPAADDVYGFNSGMYSGQPSTTDGTTISPMSSYRTDIQPSSSIITLTVAGEPESALAPKPSDATPQSLISSTAPAEKHQVVSHVGTESTALRSMPRESGRMALSGSSEAAGYFTVTPGQIKDKRLTPLQIPSSGSPGHMRKLNTSGGTSAGHSQTTSGASSMHSKNSTGPYHFLVKERLLGLYLAIFVHRDCKDWVKGFDHDYVPAGLAGGRIGNKGGIGMSLNMAGHRFLFVNSHLAAHAHRVNARIANVEKIKSELHLDCFLPESDPRAQAEDITDRFDTVFWMGDLNFRLDISRLHADWLVSRKEYAQALEFDQLRSAMTRGDVFDGFSEAPIDFAPTFKYDVWRSAKRTRSIKRKTEAKAREARKEGGEAILEVDEECETDNNFTDDQSSMITGDRRGSVDTSALSTIAGTASEGEDPPTSEGYTTVAQPHRPVAAVAKTTAIKAKHRFMKFIKSATPPVSIPSSSVSSRSAFAKSASPSRSAILSPPEAMAWLAPDVTTHTYPADLFENRRQSLDSTYSESLAAGTSSSYRPGITRQLSTKIKRRFSTSQHVNQDVNDDDDTSSSSEEDIRRGVYDSSSKQRVPSWCDRVLWKTIIEREKSQTSPTSANLLNVEGKITRIGHNLVSKLHLRREISPSDTSPQDGESQSARNLPPVQREHSSALQQMVPATIKIGAAPASRTARNLGLRNTGFSQPGYASSNPGSSDDSSPTASILDPDSFTRPRLADKIKHRSISGVMLRSPSSTTATAHEHGNRHSGMYTTSPSGKGDHAFLRSRTIGDIPHRTDTLHSLFGSDGVETSIATAKKWFNHLVRPRSDIEVAPPDRPPSPEEEPEPPRRKGEVVCLKYDTLDDADMRKLEGRSYVSLLTVHLPCHNLKTFTLDRDHRPVIFAAAVYI